LDVLLEYQLNKRISYIEGRGLTNINKAKEAKKPLEVVDSLY